MIAFRDSLLDAQFLRTLAHGNHQGAEIGECLATAATIRPHDRESWLDAWMKLGERTSHAAVDSERGGHRASARNAYLRASNYFRNAYILHLEAPLPAAALVAYRRHRETFGKAAALRSEPLEHLEIPFEKSALHGYFCGAGTGRLPLVISVGGYDSTAEESYFFNGAAAVERGYHAVTFDGPGQGDALFEHGVPFRPDWEHVISSVVDAMVARADVDSNKIVLIGESFGGYLAARAAARDPRIFACVLDPPQLNLFRAALGRLPIPAALKRGLPQGPPWVVSALRALLGRVAKKGTAGWALRRGVLTHGKATPWEYFADTARYEQEQLVTHIRCPTLVCHAADDDIAAQAKAFFDELTCEKTYLRFTAEEGAGDHCVIGNRGLYHERVFDWLGERLAS